MIVYISHMIVYIGHMIVYIGHMIVYIGRMIVYHFLSFFQIFLRYYKGDDEDDDKLFLCYGWPANGVYGLFPAGTIVRDSHHRNSQTCGEQGLNLRRILVQTFWWM